MTPLISVIVPIYKVPEEYLRQCIESIQNQTLKELEIILVDDGSPDNCGEICDEYARKDERIKVIHQPNKGVSASRNQGLSESSFETEYIAFVDADDYINEKHFEVLYGEIKKTVSDMVKCNHYCFSGNKIIKQKSISGGTIDLYESKNFKYNLITPNYSRRYEKKYYGAIRGVWGILFKKDLIKQNNLKFNENMKIGEDAIFVLSFVMSAKKIAIIDECLYYYRINEFSANRKTRSDIAEQRLLLLQEYLKSFEGDNSKDFCTCYVREILSSLVNVLKKDICVKGNNKTREDRKKALENFITQKEIKKALTICYDKSFFNFQEKLLIKLLKTKNLNVLLFIGNFLK